MKRSRIVYVVATVAAVSIPAMAMAQSYLDGSAKARGAYGSSSASRGLRSARSYTQEYRQYARSVPRVEPEVAQDASDAIGGYIAKAKKHFAWMRANAEKANDKETLTSLDEIDKNLAAAEKEHHAMHEACLKQTVDPAATMKCCQTIDESLAKAIDEHDKLMRKLGLPMPTTATKK